MNNVAALSKALVTLEYKQRTIERLKTVIKNLQSKKPDSCITAQEIQVSDADGYNKVYIEKNLQPILMPIEHVVLRAESAIEELEAQVYELTTLLSSFGKAMKPILEGQEQC